MHGLLIVLFGLAVVGFSTYALVRARQGFMVLRSGRLLPLKSRTGKMLTVAPSVFGILFGLTMVVVDVFFKDAYV